MTLSRLCFHLSARREMYLPDNRYVTAVAFIEGFNTALDGEPLRGFQSWVSDRFRPGSNLYWAFIVLSARLPGFIEDGLRLDQIPPGQDKPMTDFLVELLGEFVSSSARIDP